MRLGVGLLAAGALLFTACDIPGQGSHVHANPSSSPESAASAPLAAPSPSQPEQTAPAAAGPAGLERCHTAGLSVNFAGTEGAAGTIVDTFRIFNRSASPCTLHGFVGLQMLDSAGRPLRTMVVRNGGIFSTQGAPSRFTLPPGSAGSFRAAWSDVQHGAEGPCPAAAGVLVTPPDEYDHLSVPVSGWNLAPCAGGEIDVTPLAARQ